MVDPKNLQFGQAGQPANASQEGAPQQQTPAAEPPAGGPRYVTLEEAERIAEEKAQKVLRQAQSLNDKARAAFEKRMAELQKANIQATPEQVAKLVQAEFDEQSTQPIPSPKKPAQASTAEAGSDFDPTEAAVLKMFKEADVDPSTIAEDDPLVVRYKKAMTVRERIAVANEIIDTQQQKRTPARVPSLGGVSAGAAGGKEGLLAEYNELAKHPTQNFKRIQEVAKELRKYK